MIVLEVLTSFRRASALMSSENIETQDDQSGNGSSGRNYHSPSMDNCILAPYNFSFI
ncbi:MAG: hypothetical protein GW903_09780 [Alphaproteobacteria bacterium]|nr:hypothetical protein [Alphaproteobacteria bacterium]NCQ89295.1 hypothetical protein [Alphaproteobacteria bacterium]NCT08159.1 hypothetical protein [Alphaproteobacteria bacterium]